MVVTRHNGILVEATSLECTLGWRLAWVSDKRPGSPTEHMVLGFGKGHTVAEAVEVAMAEAGPKLRPVA